MIFQQSSAERPGQDHVHAAAEYQAHRSRTNAPSAETFVDVWRSVPTVNDVALTGPDGLKPLAHAGRTRPVDTNLDARVTTLQEQALGALYQSRRIQIAPHRHSFSTTCLRFNGRRSRTLVFAPYSDAVRHGKPLPDPDPPLNTLEQQGKVVFIRACTQCHGGPWCSRPRKPP